MRRKSRSSPLSKRCPRCRVERTRDQFHVMKRAPDGLQVYCKPCIQKRNKGIARGQFSRAFDPETGTKQCSVCQMRKPADKEYFPLHRQNGKTYLKSYCKKCDADRARNYAATRPSNRNNAANNKKWRERNPDKARQVARDFAKRRRQNPKWKVGHQISHGIWRALNGAKGCRSWESIVGYTLADLTTHLERQFSRRMTWKNFGRYWHIDHIVPVASFSFSKATDDEFIACWALTNLRPLRARDNLMKRDKRIYLL